MGRREICADVRRIAAPLAAELGLEVFDVTYEKEGPAYVLTLYIDRPEGIGSEHCEALSRLLSPALDDADPIEGAYMLSVSSPGIERRLRGESDYDRYRGERVELRLFSPVNGSKSIIGRLDEYDNEKICVNTGEADVAVDRKMISVVKLKPEINF